MDGDQGALNHALHGEFGTALNDIETSLGKLFKDDVVPALKTFIEMFASDFGSQALSIAATAVGQVATGTDIKTIAATVTAQITAAAITDAEKDGTTVLNAVRVQLTAAQVAASAVATQQAPAV